MTNNGASTTKTITTPASGQDRGQDHDHNPPPPRRDADPLNLAPHSVEAEEAVLGSILMNPEALYEVRAFLTDMDFFMLRNGWIYEALCRLADRDDAIDTRTLAEELRAQGRLEDIGGEAYLNYLPNTMPTALHAEVYGHLVERLAIRRRHLGVAGKIAELAYNMDIDVNEMMDRSQSELYAVSQSDMGEIVTFEQAANDYYIHIMAVNKGEKKPYVIDSEWPDFNKIVPGLEEGTHYLVGQKKVGKSIVLLQWLVYAAENGLWTHLLSLEMPIRQLMTRIIAQRCEITKRQQNAMSDEQHAALVEWFKANVIDLRTLSFDGGKNKTPEQIASRVRVIKRRGNLDILGVDQISMVKPVNSRYQNETYKLADIAGSLHDLSQEAHIPILIAAQLKREDDAKRPTLNSIADSDSIARWATTVIAIHDPNIGTEKEGTTRDLIVLAQRNEDAPGHSSIVPMAFQGKYFRIKQLTQSHQTKNQPRPKLPRGPQEDGLRDYQDVYRGK